MALYRILIGLRRFFFNRLRGSGVEKALWARYYGVLFRGGAEAVICKNLIRRGLIQGIIGLSVSLFLWLAGMA